MQSRLYVLRSPELVEGCVLFVLCLLAVGCAGGPAQETEAKVQIGEGATTGPIDQAPQQGGAKSGEVAGDVNAPMFGLSPGDVEVALARLGLAARVMIGVLGFFVGMIILGLFTDSIARTPWAKATGAVVGAALMVGVPLVLWVAS